MPIRVAARIAPGTAGGADPHPVQLRARSAEGKTGADRRRQHPAGRHHQSVRRDAAAQRRRDRGRLQEPRRRSCAPRPARHRTSPPRMPAGWPMRWMPWSRPGPPRWRAPAKRFVPGLKTMLGQVSDSLKAAPVTVADHAGGFPRRLGRYRRHRPHPGLPQGHQQRPAALSAFSDQVLSVAPQATGAPISIRESGKTIVGAFAEAGVLVLHRHHHPAGACAAQRA